MTRLIRLVAILTVLLITPPPLDAQRQARQFGEVVEAVVVEVPVHVVKDGAPVRGLTAENFEVIDGRKKQKLSGFEVVDLAERGPESALWGLPVPARRHFLFLFDLSFSDPANVARARAAALDVLAELHVSDLAAVATFSLARGSELVLGFTGDRRQTELAIRTLGVPGLIEKRTDPLGLVLAELSGPVDEPGVGGEAEGRRPNVDVDLMFQEHIRDLSIGMRREAREVSQGQVESMVRDFSTLARLLDSADGRKQVVLFSEGADMSILLGTADATQTRAMNEASASGRIWEIDSEERYGSTSALSFFHDMTEEFRRADAVVQAVDISNLDRDVGPGADTNQEGLFIMADETGGELYRNFTDLGNAMGQLMDRTSVTYLLAFQPEDLKLDGSYHPLKIKLKGGPSGARVVHRPGYYAPKPYQERAPMERRLDSAGKILSARAGGGIATSILAAAFPMDEERAHVPIFLELDGPSVLSSGQGGKGGKVELEIYTYAVDTTGRVGDFLTQTLGLERQKMSEQLRQGGLRFYGSLYLTAGRYTVQTLVRNRETGQHGVQSVTVDVPAFDGQSTTCSPPLFPDVGDDWLLVREATGDEEERQAEYPFTARGNAFIPAAKPVVAGSAPVGFVCYGLTDQAPQIEATVQTADGQPMDGPSIRVIEQNAGEHPGMQRILAEFLPAELAPGEYVLDVEVRAAGGGEPATASIPFVIAGS